MQKLMRVTFAVAGIVGFMLMAITTISNVSASGLLVHLAGYLITNLAIVLLMRALENKIRVPGFIGSASQITPGH